MSRLPNAPGARISVASVIVAGSLAILSGVRALRVAPTAAETGSMPPVAGERPYVPPAPAIDVEAIGQNDVFQPDRSALRYRYPMPGDSRPDDTPPPEVPTPVVLGTVLSTDGSHFATCQMPGGRPTLVRVGDRLGEYTVTTIERDRVVFKDAKGARIEVTTKK